MVMEADMFGDSDGCTPTPDPDNQFTDVSRAGWRTICGCRRAMTCGDLGPADIDTDADGIADSLTRPGPDGMAVYTDSDADGRVDLITEIGADGTLFDAAPGHREWNLAVHGFGPPA